jgi:uncharacterized cupredoxin-like copper-binding protein
MNLRTATTAAKLAFVPLAALTTIALAPADQAGASTKATTVTAIETDFHISLSKTSFKPGTYIFVAKNKGQTTHGLEITGPGLHNATSALIAPGHSTKLKVTFKAGKYDVFCPVPGHKALGMNLNLVVTSSGKASTTATTKSSSSFGGYGY